MNAQEVIDEALGQEQETEGEFYTSAELWRWVNSGQLEFCRRSTILRSSFAAVSVADQATYAYPTGMMYPLSVKYDGTKLIAASIEQMDAIFPGWEAADAATPAYYYEPTTGNIGLYPAPDVAGTSITILGIAKPTTVTSTVTTLDVPAQYHEALVEFVLCKMLKKDKRKVESNDHLATFLQMAREANVEARKMNRPDRRHSFFPGKLIR